MTYYACYVEELIAPLLLRQLPAGNAVCCATHQCGKVTCDATESSCQWLESVKSQITAIAIGNGALKWNTVKSFYCSNHLPTLAQSLFATLAVVAASCVRAWSSISWEHACLALYCQRAQRINACQHAQRANSCSPLGHHRRSPRRATRPFHFLYMSYHFYVCSLHASTFPSYSGRGREHDSTDHASAARMRAQRIRDHYEDGSAT